MNAKKGEIHCIISVCLFALFLDSTAADHVHCTSITSWICGA